MQRDILLLTEMIDAAEQAHQLATAVTVGQLETDRQRRDALLWNFTVRAPALFKQATTQQCHHDPFRAFGGLSRVQAPSGELLWVCGNHYRE